MNLDDALIEHLRGSPRASIAELAAATYHPRRAVRSRLDALVHDGVLRVVAAVHPDHLGVTAYAHLAVVVHGAVGPAARSIAEVPGVAFVSVTSGEHQVVAELRLPDQAQLADAAAAIRRVRGVRVVDALGYLEVLRGTFMTGRPLAPDRRVDALDEELMTLLQDDGRMSFRALADATGLSPSAARARVLSLIGDEVVRIAPVLNRQLQTAEIAAGIGINVSGAGDTVVDHLLGLVGVDFAARTLGRFDLVATVLATSGGELARKLDRIRELDEVTRLVSWVHLDLIKERYDVPLRRERSV
ncbi:Lrp/AsnC family transcriptional regulator [Tsukamurella ocularis]|uniref:Lrp/AsnC family transcriptional regulator n=1 Tax=Tsukamurella ocularis TaxID=1970234 RepID=UPI002168BCD6|nr:Lrp/AsnC family transcriptional regulator [Tsukamurella ocularis]